MAETIQRAAVNYLLTVPEVVAAVGKFSDSQKPFIFRGEMIANLEDDQYTAVSAIVVEDGGPLAVNAVSRFRARRLRITIWANGNRDAVGNLLSPVGVEEKINDTFIVLDKVMHRTDPEPVLWSTVRTISCDRIGDLSEPVPVIDGDGIQIATVNYAVFF